MQAFHNDPAVKTKYVNRLRAHRKAEQIIQGTGWTGLKGCAVGCTLEVYDHARYPIELGLPEWLARLEDRIFEGLPKGKAEAFAVDFLAAIPVGADVEKVNAQLAVARHLRALAQLEGNAEPYAQQVREALQKTIDWLMAEIPDEQAWSAAESAAESARSAAWSAARSAAWSAAESAAESARSAAWSARSAAESARSAAWSAARSAAWSAAESAAESARSAAWSAAESARSAAERNHYEWEAATLLQLLRDCK